METLLKECNLRFAACATPFEEARSTLQAVREAGFLTGCITNGRPCMQHHKLDVSGLRPWLDTVLVSGEEGVHKPDAELFYRAAARLGVAPEDCVFVGDHPKNDIEGAKNAGMQTVYMDAFALQKPVDAPRIERLSELLPLLRKHRQEKG